jgi:quercetin dioxygenase-like cupin family protein
MRIFPLLVPVFLVACASTAMAPAPRPILAAAPTQAVGSTTQALGTIDIGPEVNLPGYQLRARAVTIAPGGHLAVHTHQGRPTQEYVAQGTVIEVRNGQRIEHKAGTMVQASNGVTHWWENHGTEMVVLVPVDVFKP